MSEAFGQTFVRGCSRSVLVSALTRVMRRDFYEPFDPAKVPPRYPREAREFSGAALSGPDAGEAFGLVFEDRERTFARAMSLSREIPGATVLAAVRRPLAPLCLKAYEKGDVLLKIGEDPDDELFYNPRLSDGQAIGRFVATWTGSASPIEAGPKGGAAGLLGALGVTRADVDHAGALAGGWPTPVEPLLFIHRRSRLFLES
jgi:hypothetical protein